MRVPAGVMVMPCCRRIGAMRQVACRHWQRAREIPGLVRLLWALTHSASRDNVYDVDASDWLDLYGRHYN